MLLLVWDEPVRILSSRVNPFSCLFFRPLTSGLSISNAPCAKSNCHFEDFLHTLSLLLLSLYLVWFHRGYILGAFFALCLLAWDFIRGCPIRLLILPSSARVLFLFFFIFLVTGLVLNGIWTCIFESTWLSDTYLSRIYLGTDFSVS